MPDRVTSQSDSDVTRDWLVTFAHIVATERARQASHPGSVFCIMLRREEAEGLLEQVNELVQWGATSA